MNVLSRLACDPALSNIWVGVLFIFISLPLLKKKVKMNHWYGVRISKAFVSDDNWYAINEYGAKQLILWSCIMIASGLIILFIPTQQWIRISPLFICTIAPIVPILTFARKLPGKAQVENQKE